MEEALGLSFDRLLMMMMIYIDFAVRLCVCVCVCVFCVVKQVPLQKLHFFAHSYTSITVAVVYHPLH